MFEGPKRHPNDLKIYEHQFYEEEDLGAKEANERRPEAQKGVPHATPVPGRVGPPLLALVALFASILHPEASS